MMRYLKYLQYVLRHKWYVFTSGRKLGVPIHLLIMHDISKFSPLEMIPYARTFRSPSGEGWYKPDSAFDKAWLHHQNKNKHHWQYWLLIKDEGGIEALPMPDRYRKEMLADWYGAGIALGHPNIKGWYEKNMAKIILHPETRDLVDEHFGIKMIDGNQYLITVDD